MKYSDYLCERRFDDRDEARGAAAQFIEFCRGRAWVFTDTGTTSKGEKLYQFIHRTFLEYFTAAYLVRTNPTPGKLKKVLFPRIARREWDIVCQQAFQILNKNVEGAADGLVSALVEKVHKNKGKRAVNYLSFAVRALEFIIPNPQTIRDITTECIEYGCITNAMRAFYHPEDQQSQRVVDYNIKDLKKMSKIFLDYQLPLFKKDKRIDHPKFIKHGHEIDEYEEIQLSRLHFDNDSIVAFIVLNVIYLEYLEYKDKKHLHEFLERIN